MIYYFLNCEDIPCVTIKKWLSLLPIQCREHIKKYKQPHDVARSTTAYILLKYALFCDYNFNDFGIEYSPKGKPYLTNSNIQLSITHTQELVALALSDTAIGIDTEILRPLSQDMLDAFDSNSELDFYKKWTSKEAYFKQQGLGLSDDIFNEIESNSYHIILDNHIITTTSPMSYKLISIDMLTAWISQQ